MRRARCPDPGHPARLRFRPEFLNKTAPVLEFLWSKYFRIRLTGMENVPAEGAALLVANHSGGLPYDGAMLIHAIAPPPSRPHRPLRPLVANFAFQSSWMRPVVARIGGVRASMQNALALCKTRPAGRRVSRGPARRRQAVPRALPADPLRPRRLRAAGANGRRCRSSRWPSSAPRKSIPCWASSPRSPQPLGLPYIPITPTFPLLGPLGLLPVPTKWSIQIGAPIMFPAGRRRTSKEENLEMAEAVRSKLDHMIAELLAARRSILFG